MAKSKRVRWECPSGEHPAVLGPTKPRRENICRYCLRCSERAGRLVERVAPALERERAQRAERTDERRRKRETRAREHAQAARTVAGLDLEAETARLLRLPVFKRLARRGMPSIHVVRHTSKPRARHGCADIWAHGMRIADYPGIDEAAVKETLVHELVHLLVGVHRENGRWVAHGDDFCRAMDECFEAAYGVSALGSRENVYHGRYADALRFDALSAEDKLAEAERTEAAGDGALAGAMRIRASDQAMRLRARERRASRARSVAGGGGASPPTPRATGRP